MGVSIGISIAQNSQSVTNNTSNVTVAVTAKWTYGSWNATGECSGTITIDGKVYTFTGLVFNKGATTSGSEVIMTKTVTVGHNADGTKTLSCSATFVTGLSAGTVSASASKTLTTIPRATTPTVGASVRDMGDYVTIYTAAASAAFTHDLAYSFMGGAYQTIATGVKEWHNWTIPDLASQIPNAANGTVTIRCITKNGNTVIGTKTVVMTLTVPASVVPTVPEVTATENTSGLAAQFGAFIQGKSALAVKITAAGAKGSTISGYKATLQGVAYTGASFTTGALLQEGSHSLVVTVTDSRGRTASKTVAITVLPYTLPATSEFKAFRSDANGSAQDDGTYLSVAYAYSVATLGGKNTAAMVIEYKTRASNSWTQLATGRDLEGSGIRFFYDGPTFSTDYMYDVRMTVTDWFGASTTYTVTLPTADVVLDISADGTGLGVGKVSQRNNATEFGRPMYDRFDALINNGLAVYGGSGDSGIDPDTTLEHLILTETNTPAAGFWYVMTLFYSTKSVTANRTQFALPYNTAGALAVRRYYNGAWTAWAEAPAIVESGTSGLWSYVKWSDGRVELSGTHWLFGVACTTALGGWYRTDVIQPEAFPFTVYDQNLLANYESDGYGAVLWATTTTTTTKPANFYLIRPTSTTIANGKIAMRVTGRWK
jgi:hypothetical protein